jgi:hypothetical protein
LIIDAGPLKRGNDNPLRCDFLVVDETSMVDVILMQALLRANLGATAIPGSPADFGRLITGDTERLARLIRAANIKTE